MTMRNVGFRLQTDGKAEVKNDFAEVKRAGQDAMDGVADAAEEGARRATAANDQFTERQLAAFKRQAAQAKVAVAQAGAQTAFGSVAASVGSGPQVADASIARSTGAARESAAVFEEAARAEERLAAAAIKLRAALDPAFAAQNRFNREMGEARALVGAGAISLDEYVAKLRLERAALESNSVAHGRVASGAMANRMAMQGASYQVQDFITQVSMGANPINAFAVQGAQLAGQFSMVQGKAGDVARFFMGPWGLAITAGTMLLAPFIGKLIEQGSALDKATEKLREDAKQSAITDEAKRRYTLTLDGVVAALRAEREAQEQSIKSSRTAGENANIEAKNRLELLNTIRATTKARLEDAKAMLEAQIARATGPGASSDIAAQSLGRYQAEIKRIEGEITKNDKAQAEAGRQYQASRAQLASESAQRAVDPVAAIKRSYEGPDGLIAQARKRAIAEGAVTTELTRQETVLRRKMAADIAAEQRRQSQERAAPKRDGETLTSSAVSKLLRQEIPGVHITSTTGGKHVANSYHYKNQAVDFVPAGGMGSMTKDDVRQIFKSRGIDVVELLGPGDKGHSNHFHVAWTKGKLALDDFGDAARRAQADLGKLQSLTGAYDPAQAATDKYKNDLAEITRLKPANADQLAAGARDAFVKARAAAFTMDDVESVRPEAEAEDKARAEREASDKRRREYAADRTADQGDTIRMLDLELQLMGANDDVRSSQLNKLEIILDLKRRGIDAESAEGREILANAAAIDEKTARLKVQAAAVDELRGFLAQFVDTVLSEDTWSSWGNAGKTILNELKNEFIKLALLNPLKNMINRDNKLPTLTSAIAGIGKLFNPGKNAVGTHNWSGGLTWVAENGPELINLPQGTKITPATQTRQMLAGNDNGRAPTHNHFDLRGAVVTQDLLDQMNAIGAGAAMHGAAGGAAIGQAEARASGARRLGRRW